jgi:hypothetical protein
MPQISKVRIVNFSYNDGKRLIADEIYDFASADKNEALNTFIHLGNGGGKSILVQLMLQPIVPKAKVAGRKIEGNFTKSSDHCFVVIEWFKDNSSEKLMTGISMASGESSDESNEELKGKPVKYYTFICNDSKNSDIYNIIDLPLSTREKNSFIALPYNGVKELSKKSNGKLICFSSDDSRLWREKLSEYGVVQEEWKNIIEEINSEEGGMTKFFGNFKDSNQLMNQLLIPAIEGKYSTVTSKEGDSPLYTMFMNHLSSYREQKERLGLKQACEKFKTALNSIDSIVQNVWNRNHEYERCIQELTAFNGCIVSKQNELEDLIRELDEDIEKSREELKKIEYEKRSDEFYSAKKNVSDARQNYDDKNQLFEEVKKQLDEAERKVKIYNCAKKYQDICDNENKLKAVKETIKAKSENSETQIRMRDLGFSVIQQVNSMYPKIKEDLSMVTEELNNLSEKLSVGKSTLDREKKIAEEKKDDFQKKDNAFEFACSETDKIIEKLNIPILRFLDGFYNDNQVQINKDEKNKEKSELNLKIEKLHTESERLTSDNKKIEEQTSKLKEDKFELTVKRNNEKIKFDAFCELESTLQGLCKLYNLQEKEIYNGQLLNYILNLKSNAVAKKENISANISVIDDEINAAEKGYVHVSKRVIEFLDQNGIQYQTCEKYLDSIVGDNFPKEKCLEMISNNPVIAYGIIVSKNEKERLNEIQRTVEEWLPSIVPVFLYEEIKDIISNTSESNNSNYLAFYSQEYFMSKDTFTSQLKDKKEKLEKYKEDLSEKIETFDIQKTKAEEMSLYSEEAHRKFEEEIRAIDSNLTTIIEKIAANCIAVSKNETEIKRIETEKEEYRKKLNDVDRWFEKFTELETRLKTEKSLKIISDQARHDYDTARKVTEQQERDIKKLDNEISNARINKEEKFKIFEKLDEVHTELEDITEGNQIEGEWDALLYQYHELKQSQNKEIEVLTEKEQRFLDNIKRNKEELKEYDLPEETYQSVIYDENIYSEIKKKQAEYLEYKEQREKEKNNANIELSKCEGILQSAENNLKEYNGTPDATENIKGNYAKRKESEEIKIKESEKKRSTERTKKDEIDALTYRTKEKLNSHKRMEPLPEYILKEDVAEQFEDLSLKLAELQKKFISSSKTLSVSLEQELSKVNIYQSYQLQSLQNFRTIADSDEIKGDKYFTLSEQIENVINTVDLQLAKIETDLKEFSKSKSDLVQQSVYQGRRIFDGLNSMVERSGVAIIKGQSPKRMIRIDFPLKIDENISRNAIETELDEGIEEVILLQDHRASDSEIRKAVNSIIGSPTLLRKYVGKDEISISVYKIDLNPENAKYRTWKETQINSSGGEKLVSYFALIMSLLNYSRGNGIDINDKKLTNVLILDNPFGAVSSGHLLKPMFEIARHFRVQLICLSDIDKVDIVSNFDIVIRAAVRPLRFSNQEILTHEGNEKIEHGFYRSQQISML